MRCTKSVSIPAPVHYAHLAAYASRIMNFGEEHDQDTYATNDVCFHHSSDAHTSLVLMVKMKNPKIIHSMMLRPN